MSRKIKTEKYLLFLNQKSWAVMNIILEPIVSGLQIFYSLLFVKRVYFFNIRASLCVWNAVCRVNIFFMKIIWILFIWNTQTGSLCSAFVSYYVRFKILITVLTINLTNFRIIGKRPIWNHVFKRSCISVCIRYNNNYLNIERTI